MLILNTKEVSKKLDISIDTLRYYERIGLIPMVGRNENGYRNYTEQDLYWVSFVKAMRDAGVSIEALIEYITLFNLGENTVKARKKILIEQREVIKEKTITMQKTLERLDKKIEVYDDLVLKFEEKLKK
ncbi:MAG: MerR family transcriptional regulator [Peptostreptococcaceae bacterium]